MATGIINKPFNDRFDVRSIAANASYTYTLESSAGYVLIISGISARRGFYLAYCASAGTVSETAMQTSSVITIDNSVANKLKITASSAVVATLIKVT